MSRWDASQIPDLTGRTAIVTGANAGLGLETARLLAGAGARVLMACRNLQKAETAAAAVGHGAEVVALDLSSLAEVEKSAAAVQGMTSRLDILVNNAGLMAVDQGQTADGFEMQFGVNHLGHFAFTAHLAPLLLATPEARIVNVSSMGHRMGTMHFSNLMFDGHYDRWRPYFQSKLANLLFTSELENRLRTAGSSARALAAHPGATNTDLGYEGKGLTNALIRPFSRFAQSVKVGALPTVRAAVDPDAKGGEYYGPQFLAVGYPVREVPSRAARNRADAIRLWEESERLTGVRFDLS
ncbi:MAG TPA: oxidoreductase [Acidimicrobiales bacterium]|jgi:NAD(P)-dependent dehydrogenase (short-subunit alcohol dehydrogenase family)|nr:oxidoreductase [Acidimicrobiales bacterium]